MTLVYYVVFYYTILIGPLKCTHAQAEEIVVHSCCDFQTVLLVCFGAVKACREVRQKLVLLYSSNHRTLLQYSVPATDGVGFQNSKYKL